MSLKLLQSNTLVLPFHFKCSTVQRPAYLSLGVEGCCRLHKEHLHPKYGALFLLSTVCRSADTEIKNVKFNLVWFNAAEENHYLYAAELWLCVSSDLGLSLWVKILQVCFRFCHIGANISWTSEYVLRWKWAVLWLFISFLFLWRSVCTRMSVGGPPPTLL